MPAARYTMVELTIAGLPSKNAVLLAGSSSWLHIPRVSTPLLSWIALSDGAFLAVPDGMPIPAGDLPSCLHRRCALRGAPWCQFLPDEPSHSTSAHHERNEILSTKLLDGARFQAPHRACNQSFGFHISSNNLNMSCSAHPNKDLYLKRH
jgi:hypothetical protein